MKNLIVALLLLLLPCYAIADEGQVVVVKERCERNYSHKGTDCPCSVTIINIGETPVRKIKVWITTSASHGIPEPLIMGDRVHYLPPNIPIEVNGLISLNYDEEVLYGKTRVIYGDNQKIKPLH